MRKFYIHIYFYCNLTMYIQKYVCIRAYIKYYVPHILQNETENLFVLFNFFYIHIYRILYTIHKDEDYILRDTFYIEITKIYIYMHVMYMQYLRLLLLLLIINYYYLYIINDI